MATKYLVFKQKTEGGWYEELPQEAASAHSAIRKHMENGNAPDSGGTFVAIPSRSFKPVTVKVERTVKLS